jgi:hypothetical protein
MDSEIKRRAGLALLLLLCISICISVAQTGCSDQRVLIDIALNGVPATATGLRVRPKLDGRLLRDALPPITIPPSETLSYFKASLSAADTRGQLQLTAVLYADDACSVGIGSTELTIGGPGTYRGSIDVSPQVGCELILSKLGDGVGTITTEDGTRFDFLERAEGSLSCPRPTNPLIEQRKVFPFGTRLVLRGSVEDERARDSVFGGWASPECTSAQCSIEIGGEPATLKPLFFSRNVCSPDRVCWRHPLPQGVNLRHINGTTSGDVWAVGDRGTVLHWNGFFWSSPPRPPHRGPLNAVSFLASPVSAFTAVGDTGSAVQFTDGTWACPTQAAAATLRGVSGAAANDLWAVGDRGTLSHYDGKSWTPQQAPGGFTGTLHAISGRSAKDLWAVGEQGTVLRYDGTSWSRFPVPTTETLFGLWLDREQQIWLVGDRGTTVLIDQGVAKLVLAEMPVRLYGVWGSGPRDVWAVGAFGTILHYVGERWSVTPSGTTQDLLGAWGADASQIWAIGDRGVILKYNGAFWRADGAVQSTENLNGLWSSGPEMTSSIAVGDRGTIFRWTGSDWLLISAPGQLTSRSLRAAWGASAMDVWAVGEGGTVARMSGAQAQLVTTGIAVDLNAIWGRGASDIYAVGQSGALARYNGTAWSVAMLPAAAGATLRAVFGTAASELWIAGDSGLLLRWNGTTATAVPSGTVRTLRALWGSSPSDVWAAGDGGTILHYDGSQWRPDPQSGQLTSGSLFAISGAPSQTVWAAGESGALLRRRGGTWTSLDTGTPMELRALALFLQGALVMVGQSATILDRAPDR